jgi:hypothetical protein
LTTPANWSSPQPLAAPLQAISARSGTVAARSSLITSGTLSASARYSHSFSADTSRACQSYGWSRRSGYEIETSTSARKTMLVTQIGSPRRSAVTPRRGRSASAVTATARTARSESETSTDVLPAPNDTVG